MIINHNLGAMNANRNMGINQANAGKSMEKLSSGLRINRAGDDAAGLAISEKMRGQIRGLDQASANAQDGISLAQTAEGALSETHSILQRMRELSVQSGNDTATSADRTAMQKEVTQLTDEIDRISNQTEFNTKTLLKGGFGNTNVNGSDITSSKGIMAVDTSNAAVGTYAITNAAGTLGAGYVKMTVVNGSTTKVYDNIAIPAAGKTADYNMAELGIKLTLTDSLSATTQAGGANGTITVSAGANGGIFHVGANSGQTIGLKIADMSSTGLGVDASKIDITGQTGAESALTTIDTAIAKVSTERSNLGAFQNRLEHTIANLGTASENLTSAESRIRDVNMAKEMSTFSKNNILSQAAQAMLAQANQQPQQVLQLLR